MINHKLSINHIDEIDFSKITLKFREDDIVEVHIKEHSMLEIEDVQEQYLFMKDKVGPEGNKYLVLPGFGSSVSHDAKGFSKHPEVRAAIKAQAIVVNNLAHKLIINFIQALIGNDYPLKSFSDKDEAVAWLKSFD